MKPKKCLPERDYIYKIIYNDGKASIEFSHTKSNIVDINMSLCEEIAGVWNDLSKIAKKPILFSCIIFCVNEMEECWKLTSEGWKKAS